MIKISVLENEDIAKDRSTGCLWWWVYYQKYTNMSYSLSLFAYLIFGLSVSKVNWNVRLRKQLLNSYLQDQINFLLNITEALAQVCFEKKFHQK